MTFQCFECCKEIQSYPCACGYRPKALVPVQNQAYWLIQPCTSCRRAVIRVPVSQSLANPICKWCEGQAREPLEAVLDTAAKAALPRMTAVSELLKKMQLANS